MSEHNPLESDVSVSQVLSIKDALAVLRSLFWANQKVDESLIPFFLGAPGIGKTQAALAFCHELNELRPGNGLPWKPIQFRLNQREPVDLSGIPFVDSTQAEDGHHYKHTRYAAPKLFPIVDEPLSGFSDFNTYLIMDEVAQAEPATQHVASNIIDRVIGDYMLDPVRSYAVAMSNRPEDRSATYMVPRSLVNRVCMLEVGCSIKDWEEWAIVNGVRNDILAFVTQNSCYFQEVPGERTVAFCTPRSWTYVSRYLDATDKPLGIEHHIVEGYVGPRAASAFYIFRNYMAEHFSFDEISKGKYVPISKELDEIADCIYAIALEGSRRINLDFQQTIYTSSSKIDERVEQFYQTIKGDKMEMLFNLMRWFETEVKDPRWMAAFYRLLDPKFRASLNEGIILSPHFRPLANGWKTLRTAYGGD